MRKAFEEALEGAKGFTGFYGLCNGMAEVPEETLTKAEWIKYVEALEYAVALMAPTDEAFNQTIAHAVQEVKAMDKAQRN